MFCRCIVVLAALAMLGLPATPAAAQDCPTAKTGRTGFIVERDGRSKTEVTHVGDDLVLTVLRQDGKTLLETTQFRGLLQLDRLENGRKTIFRAQNDLATLFPLKPGEQKVAKFDVEERNSPLTRLDILLGVQEAADLSIGACKYRILKIERKQSYRDASPRFVNFDYYAPDLKLIIGKEYKERDGRMNLIKFDRIYAVKR
jgi:hypothetical protein